MARQLRGTYAKSSRDFIEAADFLEKLQTFSVSEGTASFVVNDAVQEFRGVPFERTLLHAFTAKNHLALGAWDSAAVEARRIIYSLTPGMRGDYPEDAYSRYMAGFCLEMIGDDSNAALQYRKAAALLKSVTIDASTGRPARMTTNAVPAGVDGPPASTRLDRPAATELVCFVIGGRSPTGSDTVKGYWPATSPVHGEIYCRGEYAGRSYTLADTLDLAFTTEQMQAARKAVKTVTRIAIKEGIASAVEENDELLGLLVRFILLGLLEQQDVRRWETLPRWLGVARVPCPDDLTDFEVVFKNAGGSELGRLAVREPIARRGNIFVSFCRDLQVRTQGED